MKNRMMVVASTIMLTACFAQSTVPATPAQQKVSTETPPQPTVTPGSQNPVTSTTAPEVTSSPVVPVVVAQEPGVKLTDVAVGDPDLNGLIKFSVDRAANVVVRPEKTDSLRLFRVRDDQYGQKELVSSISASGSEAVISLPAEGTYFLAGTEKPFPFGDVPLGGGGAQAYRTQALHNLDCPAFSQEIRKNYGGYPALFTGLTRDTEYPVKITVYVHRGSGNSDDPEDNFQNWINYNQTTSPDKAALAERVRAYIPDYWDSGVAPDISAGRYNAFRNNCGIPCGAWIDVCHSMSCLLTKLALLQSWQSRPNNIGIIACAPAFGGSHWPIRNLINATLAQQYGLHGLKWSTIRTLVQWEWGWLFGAPSWRTALTGTPFSLYNEGGRSLAWNGAGTGIPRQAYSWFSIYDTTTLLKRVLRPNDTHTMPQGNALSVWVPEDQITEEADGRMFNYIDAVNAMEEVASKADHSFMDGKIDIAVTYMNDSTAAQSSKIKEFEEKYGKMSLLEFLWRGKADAAFRRDFARAALPWMNAVVAKSPSVVPSDPNPNENAAGDGALTICEQVNCSDGPSILSGTSRYGALVINRSAIDARKSTDVGECELFEGRKHDDAVTGNFRGGDHELWDWMNARLIARVDKLREEENSYVLTDVDKKRILDNISPPNGMLTIETDYDMSIGHGRTKTTYTLYADSIQWTQDPLGTKQRNRIRLVGKGRLRVDIYHYNDLIRDFIYDYNSSKTNPWNVNEDFIARRGVLQLVIN